MITPLTKELKNNSRQALLSYEELAELAGDMLREINCMYATGNLKGANKEQENRFIEFKQEWNQRMDTVISRVNGA